MTTATITDSVVTATVTDDTVTATVADSTVSATISGGLAAASESLAGALAIATSAEATALTATNKALTPSTFGDALTGVEGTVIHASLNGAVGDGTTDDTAAIQAILTANQGVNDIILRFSSDATYILGALTWTGGSALIIECDGATLKLANTTNTSMFTITNPTYFKFIGGIIDGNDANNTVGGVAALIDIVAGANSESVAITRTRFQNSDNGAINIGTASAGAVGFKFISVTDIEMDRVVIGGAYNALRMRGNQENVVYDNIRAYDCCSFAGAKMIAWSAEVGDTSDRIGNISVNNVVMDHCGTSIFGQAYKNAVISNVACTDIGVGADNTHYNNVFIKIDDATPDAKTLITNCTGTSTNTTLVPALSLEESTGTGQAITQNVQLSNVYCDGAITLTATGGHSALKVDSGTSLTTGDNVDLLLCSAVANLNIQGADNVAVGCRAVNINIQAAALRALVSGCHGTIIAFDGATDVIIEGCVTPIDGRIRLMGDYQTAKDCRCITTANTAISIEKTGAIWCVIDNCTVSSTETFATTPVILLSNPNGPNFVRNNIILASSGTGSIGRNTSSYSMFGEIRGNRGVTANRGLDATLGDLILDDNGYWNAGTWTPLAVTNIPTGFTGHG